MVDANGRYFLESKTLGSFNPAMPGENSSRSINHDGPDKAKTLDTFRQLLNLSIAVNPRISKITFQIGNRESNDRGRQPGLCARWSTGGFGCLR